MISLRPIGVIRTPFSARAGTPIQGALAPDVEGTVEVHEEYLEGLTDVDGFSHLILLYLFDQSDGYALRVKPYLDPVERGLFATRAPRRPNPIGLTIVRLLSIEGCRLKVAGVDMLDGTPLLDIKPFVPDFDVRKDVSCGWIDGRRGADGELPSVVADGRFGSRR